MSWIPHPRFSKAVQNKLKNLYYDSIDVYFHVLHDYTTDSFEDKELAVIQAINSGKIHEYPFFAKNNLDNYNKFNIFLNQEGVTPITGAMMLCDVNTESRAIALVASALAIHVLRECLARLHATLPKNDPRLQVTVSRIMGFCERVVNIKYTYLFITEYLNYKRDPNEVFTSSACKRSSTSTNTYTNTYTNKYSGTTADIVGVFKNLFILTCVWKADWNMRGVYYKDNQGKTSPKPPGWVQHHSTRMLFTACVNKSSIMSCRPASSAQYIAVLVKSSSASGFAPAARSRVATAIWP